MSNNRPPLLAKMETWLLIGVSTVAAAIGAVFGTIGYYQHWLG